MWLPNVAVQFVVPLLVSDWLPCFDSQFASQFWLPSFAALHVPIYLSCMCRLTLMAGCPHGAGGYSYAPHFTGLSRNVTSSCLVPSSEERPGRKELRPRLSHQDGLVHGREVTKMMDCHCNVFPALALAKDVDVAGLNLREFVITHVILAPGACGREAPSSSC